MIICIKRETDDSSIEVRKQWGCDNGIDPDFALFPIFVDLGARTIHFNQIVTTAPEGEFPDGIRLNSIAEDNWRCPGVDSDIELLTVPRTVPLLVDPPIAIIEGGE